MWEMIVRRFDLYFPSGTCTEDGGRVASFVPSHMIINRGCWSMSRDGERIRGKACRK
jgi:hypothetical protein